jgi:hypothetical protein
MAVKHDGHRPVFSRKKHSSEANKTFFRLGELDHAENSPRGKLKQIQGAS